MGGVFLSYRRDDTRGSAGRLYGDLTTKFGKDSVFRDLDAIEAGVDFTAEISKAVASCDALIALIGKGWLSAADANGNRRLDDPKDLVRLEIAIALEQGKMVIPVLIEEAAMPTEADLPEPLRPLASRNALPISDLRWDYDVDRLVSRLKRLLARKADPIPTPRHPPPRAMPVVPDATTAGTTARARFPAALGGFVAGIVVVLVLLLQLGTFSDESQPGGTKDMTGTTSVTTTPGSLVPTVTTDVTTGPSTMKSHSDSMAKITKLDGITLNVQQTTLYLHYCGGYGVKMSSGQTVPFEAMMSIVIQRTGTDYSANIALISGEPIKGKMDCVAEPYAAGKNSVGDVNVQLDEIGRIDLRQ